MNARHAATLGSALLALPLAAVAGLTTPDCDVIKAWAEPADRKDVLPYTPRLKIPRALTDAQLVPVFGQPVGEWSAKDISSINRTITGCDRAARRARDREASTAFRRARTLIASDLRRAARSVDRARKIVEALRKTIAALPDSTTLYRGLSLLVDAGSYAAIDHRALHSLDRTISQPLGRLYATLRDYPDAQRQALFHNLAARRDDIRKTALEQAAARIAEAPADAGGLLLVRRTAFEAQRDYGGADGKATAPISTAADRRAAEISTALTQEKGIWRPPSCEALYRWGSAPDALKFKELGQYSYHLVFSDDRVVALFGRPLGEWTQADLGHYQELATLCDARWRALTSDPSRIGIGRLPPDAPALLRLASTGHWLTGRGTAPPELTRDRQALRGYAKVRMRFDALRAELAALPHTKASLGRINAMVHEPVLNQVAREDRIAFQRDLQTARNGITAGMAGEIVARVDAIVVEQPSDLGKLWRLRQEPAIYQLDPASRIAVQRHLMQRLMKETAAQRPAFEAALSRLPVSKEGMQQAMHAPADLTGLPKNVPFLTPYHKAALKRAQAIAVDMRRQRCEALWQRLEMDEDDAGKSLWLGSEGGTLGGFVCAVEEAGNEVNDYEGAGLLSGTHTLKLTTGDHSLHTLSLHEAEVAAGKQMLIGYEVADANETRKLSVAEWSRFVAGLTGDTASGGGDCARLLNMPVYKLSVNERMRALGCIMQSVQPQAQ